MLAANIIDLARFSRSGRLMFVGHFGREVWKSHREGTFTDLISQTVPDGAFFRAPAKPSGVVSIGRKVKTETMCGMIIIPAGT